MKRSFQMGPVLVACEGKGHGYYAKCRCGWSHGKPERGWYVWTVTERAKEHLLKSHDAGTRGPSL
jgi:hypothetical protein